MALLVGLVPAGSSQVSTLTASTVISNPDYETQAVDANGIAWGRKIDAPSQLWRSSDEGATWARVAGWDSVGKRPWYITPLASGALLIAYDSTTHWSIARSTDNGATWTTVLALPCIADDCTVRYTTLGPRSIAQGDGYVFLGTYSNSSAGANTNYLYRSADDGATWQVSNTSDEFRHIHGLQFDPAQHRLYVFFGDSAGMATWYSADDGATLSALCTTYNCTAIQGIVAPDGSFVVAGTDNPGPSNQIFRLDAATGARTNLAAISYPSYSSNSVEGTWLVGETHEAGGITDPQIHLYGSNDGGSTWVVLYAFTIPSQSDYEIHVESVYPNGDVAVDVSGHGTVVLRLGADSGGSEPANIASPTIVGSTQSGSTLTASQGNWSGSPSSYGYQWRRCDTVGAHCSDIAAAATSNYVAQGGDVGSTLRVTVTATNAYGVASAGSLPTPVVAGAPSPPTNVTLPTLAGAAQQGSTLTATTGSWTGSPTSFTYQWRRCDTTGAACSEILGASSPAYLLQAADLGATLRATLTATNGAGGNSADSPQTAVITTAPQPPVNSSLPTLSGQAKQGNTLNATNGSWTGSPTSFTYQWRRCDSTGAACGTIAGAAAPTYLLQAVDVGATVRARVTAANGSGSASALSAQTTLVLPDAGSGTGNGGGGGGSSSGGSGSAPRTIAANNDPASPPQAVAETSGTRPTPTTTVAPAITGALRLNKIVRARRGSWLGSPTSYRYQWLRCNSKGAACTAIRGATAATRRLTALDVRHTLRIKVAASAGGAWGSSISAPTAAVKR